MGDRRQAAGTAWGRIPWGLMLAVGLSLLVGCGGAKQQRESGQLRIVSLAPSLTEILFGLGVGDSLVADTAYCVCPEGARALPKVGAWTDVNVEQVLSFSPTHICMAETHPKRDSFEKLGAVVVAVPGQTLEDVLTSVGQLGAVFGREHQAEILLAAIRARMDALRRRQRGRPRMRTLVMISRNRGEGSLRNMIVAGDDGYYSELLPLAGCDMVPQGLGVAYPSMSSEGIAALNPQVILEIAPDLPAEKRPDVLKDWQSCLPAVEAVRAGRLLVFTETWASVPGLRSVEFAEHLADAIEAFGERRP